MARTLNIRKQKGFSLIEALFSALILGIALLALAGFQAVALQDSSLIKARSVATSLAQEKLDDLRSFTYLTDGDTSDDSSAATTTNYCGQGTFCFSEIDDNVGGQEEAGGSLKIPTGTVSGYLDSYTREWTVTCSAEAAATAFSFSTTCDSTTVAKLVTVRIFWTDSKGASQEVRLQGVIYAMDPSRVARGAASSFSTQKPQQSYTPIGVPDAVPVPISSGDGKFKESSKPLPDVSSKGYSLRTEFDAVSYTTVGGASKKDSQFEFATVNCVCEYAGSGSGYPASYFYWDGANLQVKVPGATVTKMTGTAPTISGDKQDPLCDECCRDHHDSEAPGAGSPTTALYDPDRPAADYTGSNHKHYYYTDANDPTQGLVEVAESAGNFYLEACRFVRVDGLYRLLQDWRALDMVVMPKDDYLETTTTLTAYQTYLVDYLRYQSREDCTEASGTGCTNIDQSSAPLKSSLATRDLPGQATNSTPQLLARALYSDRVYGETTPRTLDAAYYTALAAKINEFEADDTVSWLDRVPFNEVNVTLLASWHSDDTASVSVQNQEIKSISATIPEYYGVYKRGEILVNSGGDGIANIWAYLLPSNSGLTGGVTRNTYLNMTDYNASTLIADGTVGYASELGTDPHDHASSGRMSNSLQVTRAGSTPAQASGSVLVGNSSVDLATVTVAQMTGFSACTVSYTAGDNSGSFNCSTGYTGDVQIAGTGYFFNSSPDVNGDGKFDATVDVGGTYTNTNSCSASGNCGNFWVFGPTAYVSGKCHDNQCANATFDYTTDESTYTACTLDIDGSTVKCLVTLDPSTHTWSGKIRITGNGSIYVKADATSCDSGDGTGAKLIASAINAGPADKQSAFDVCATDTEATPSPPPAPTLVSLAIDGANTGNTASFKLIWADVSGETNYTVYKCVKTNAQAACTTFTAAATLGANTTTNNQSLGSNDTLCVNVVASNAGGPSAASNTKCIYYKKNNTPVEVTP